MENEFCRSRTTRWADVEAEEDDDLDMSLPVERTNKPATTSVTETVKTTSSSNVNNSNDKADIKKKFNSNNSTNNNSGTVTNRQNKKVVNLPREAPFIAKVTNLDYTLQLKDIQDFFKNNDIDDVKIKLPMRNGNNEGVAIVEFANFEDFSNTVNNLEGMCIGSRNIRVNAVIQKNKDDNKMSHRGNNISRSGGNSNNNYSCGNSQNNINQNNFMPGNNRGNKAQNMSNRDPSPDFTIVRRMNPTKSDESNDSKNQPSANSSSSINTSSSGSKPVSSSQKDFSSDKSKPISKPRSHNSSDQPHSSSSTQNETCNNSSNKSTGTYESDRTHGAGGNRRWNFGASKEKGRFKQTGNENGQYRTTKGGGGSGNGSGGGRSTMSREFVGGSSMTRGGGGGGGGGKEGSELKRGGYHGSGEGISGNHTNRGVNSHNVTSSGGGVSESRISSGSKGKTFSQKGGNRNTSIETRNRFAALDES